MEKVKRLSLSAGCNFFEKYQSKYFSREIESKLFENNCFVVSQNCGNGKKYIVVRYNVVTHRINTVGNRIQFKTLETAVATAKKKG